MLIRKNFEFGWFLGLFQNLFNIWRQKNRCKKVFSIVAVALLSWNVDGLFAGFRDSIRAIHEATVDPITTKKQDEKEESQQNWKIKMLYDGDCPLCMREVCT